MKNFFRIVLKSIAGLVWICPRRLYLGVGDTLAFLVFSIFRFRRKLVMANLRLAYPAMDEKLRKKIAFGAYRNMGRGLFEYALIPFLTRDNIGDLIDLQGAENMEKARALGKGVFLFTGHFGNGDLAQVGLVLMGYPVGSISKRFKSKWLNELWFGLRESKGLQYIPEEKSSFQILRHLRKQDIVIFVLDQFMGPPVGVLTRFFGVETGTAAGLAVLALRTQAPILPAYTYRKPDGRHTIVFEPPMFVSEGQGEAEVQQLTQAFNDKIERWVRLHPDQWMWLHRRWKKFEIR